MSQIWSPTSGGTGGGAPTNATYITLTTSTGLTNERTIAVQSGVFTLTDGGAGGNFTIGAGSQLSLIAGRTVIAAGAVTMTNADGVVNIKKTVGAATAVTGPPSPVAWQVYTVKDAKGDAATNPITITPASGTIDGQSTYVIQNNYDSVDFYSDGTNLFTK